MPSEKNFCNKRAENKTNDKVFVWLSPWCTSVFLTVRRQHYWVCTAKILVVHIRHTSCAPPGSGINSMKIILDN